MEFKPGNTKLYTLAMVDTNQLESSRLCTLEEEKTYSSAEEVPRECQERAKEVPKKCRGSTKEVLRTYRGSAEEVPRKCQHLENSCNSPLYY